MIISPILQGGKLRLIKMIEVTQEVLGLGLTLALSPQVHALSSHIMSAEEKGKTFIIHKPKEGSCKNPKMGTSLVVQWLRICLPM